MPTRNGGSMHDSSEKIERDRGRRSKLAALYNELHTLCKRALRTLVLCDQDEVHSLRSPTNMIRQRTLRGVIEIFGRLRSTLIHLRDKNRGLKVQQEQIWMEQEDDRFTTSACAPAREYAPQDSFTNSTRRLNTRLFTNENHDVCTRACWIKLGGKRRLMYYRGAKMRQRRKRTARMSQTGQGVMRSPVFSRVPSPPDGVKDSNHDLKEQEKEKHDANAVCARAGRIELGGEHRVMHHRVAKRKALSQTGDKAYTLRSSVTSRVPSPPSAVKDKTHGLTRKEKENPDVDACALVRRNTPQAELAANPLSCTRDNVRSTLGCWIKLGAKRRLLRHRVGKDCITIARSCWVKCGTKLRQHTFVVHAACNAFQA